MRVGLIARFLMIIAMAAVVVFVALAPTARPTVSRVVSSAPAATASVTPDDTPWG